jgi:hypothetical protein
MNQDQIINLYNKKSEILNAIWSLEKIEDKLFKTDTNLKEEISSNLSPVLQTIVMELVEKNINNHQTVKELIDEIINTLKNIPILKLQAGFMISVHLINQITGRLENLAKEKIIIETKQNSSLELNQIIIEFKGKRTNYTPI